MIMVYNEPNQCLIRDEKGILHLFSYLTEILKIDTNKRLVIFDGYFSKTSTNHIKKCLDFLDIDIKFDKSTQEKCLKISY